jgi:hypothetical protein
VLKVKFEFTKREAAVPQPPERKELVRSLYMQILIWADILSDSGIALICENDLISAFSSENDRLSQKVLPLFLIFPKPLILEVRYIVFCLGQSNFQLSAIGGLIQQRA